MPDLQGIDVVDRVPVTRLVVSVITAVIVVRSPAYGG